jgi:hypothetical protein
VTTEERLMESWSAADGPASRTRAFAGWDPLAEAIIAQTKTMVPERAWI